MTNYAFKIATSDAEYEQIHRLNYRTFVEEIPQHPPNPERRLVDKFHGQNCYLICLDGDRLAGMVAIRDRRPFSLDAKVADLDSYLPPYRAVCEIRLLAIEPEHRNGTVFGGLLQMAFSHRLSQGYDLAVMSGTTRQIRLYKRLGFVPFGPLVGPSEAQYQPMYWTWDNLQHAVPWLETLEPKVKSKEPFQHVVNVLPGPVTVHPDVKAAFTAPAISHRLPKFVADVQHTKHLLCSLTAARSVEIFMGGGTLANDVVACQLRLENEPGLVLENGEFGRRLAGHARRAGLQADILRSAWGAPLEYARIAQILGSGQYGWLWATHCETSTGILNDPARLRLLCQRAGAKLCLDAVSSLGLMPVDLSGVYLASGVSGKGLASMPGLGLVFYNHPIDPHPDDIPSYLDLGTFASRQGVPFTISSNLVYALRAALEALDLQERCAQIEQLSRWCRARLAELGIEVLAAVEEGAPAVLSLLLPDHVNSLDAGQALEQEGYLLSYASSYLIERNILQICFFSPTREEQLRPLLQMLKKLIAP